MTAHLPDWDLWNELLVQLYRAIDPVEHTETMLAVIQKLVPGESVILNILDLPTRNLSVVSVPADLLRPDEVELVAGYLHESPFPAYYVATGDPHWKMTTDFMPPEDFHATDLHRIGLSRWEANLQICGMLAIVDDTVHGVVINRASRGFDERERDILNALHPHLVTSYLNARAFGRAQDSVAELRGVMETAPGAYGCFREDGSLGWMQERARTWLREFFPDELVDPQGLPASIRRLVKKSRAAKNAPQSHEVHLGDQRLVACLSASPMGGWILRLECGALTPCLRLRPIPGLSVREQEVLRWMVEGKRNSEIATILGLSVRTVEKHVEAALRCLHAENRATAIIRAMEFSASPPPVPASGH